MNEVAETRLAEDGGVTAGSRRTLLETHRPLKFLILTRMLRTASKVGGRAFRLTLPLWILAAACSLAAAAALCPTRKRSW